MCEDAMRNYRCRTDCEADGDHEVILSSLVKISGESPSSCVGVVRLHGCTAPRCVAVAFGQYIGVRCNDRHHHDVADESTEDSAPTLREEHDTRRNLDCMGPSATVLSHEMLSVLTVLAHLQIVGQVDGIADDVV
jgi:hypothetical protein